MRTRIAVVLSLVLVAASCTTDPEPSATTVSQSSIPSTSSSTPLTTVGAPTTTTREPSTTTVAPTTTTVPVSAGPWDTWTLIYASLETSSHTRADAEAIAAGIEDAGVIRSDDYPSLNPGYWVVYAGEWGTRFDAGLWCPSDLDPGLSCYPRYFGEATGRLLASGVAVAQLDEDLVLLDPSTGEVLRTVVTWFEAESFPGRLALDRDHGSLFYGLGFEDSWYSCESESGFVKRLDLDSGAAVDFSDGWAPTISPDGRWLAVVSASRCLPDPENSAWFAAPGDTIDIYDLATGIAIPAHSISIAPRPLDYSDPHNIRDVFWDDDSATLLVELGDDTVRAIAMDSSRSPAEAPVVFETDDRLVAAATAESLYVVTFLGNQSLVITEISRVTGEVSAEREMHGWWAAIARSPSGDVLIGADGMLVLPNGEEIPIKGTVRGLAW